MMPIRYPALERKFATRRTTAKAPMESLLSVLLHTLVSTAERTGNWSVGLSACNVHDSIRALLALICRTDVSLKLEDLLG